MNLPSPDSMRALKERASATIIEVIGPAAESVDRDAAWPAAGMAALAASKLTGLTAPLNVGGIGQGLVGLATVTEMIGSACASTSMCFGMHCVATAVIAAKATRFQEEKYLAPIASGEHLTTLALSEHGTGSNFFMPQTALERDGDSFVVNGEKRFVTNGPHVDSFVLSTLASSDSTNGEFNCIAVDRGTPGVGWAEPWAGFGMRGNDSRGLRLQNVRVPSAHLLGEEGDQVWYVFEVVAPYFLTAMAGTYLGVAQAALDITVAHMKSRQFTHSGQSLADVELLQHRVGQLWMGVAKARLLLHHAAGLGDLGSPDALTPVLAAKADAANVAVATTNEAMTLCGGSAYRDNATLTRLLRDARASHVMSPTTDMLTLWTGRSVLGQALL
jgi:isovaleryl-CoA dehydrogenase